MSYKVLYIDDEPQERSQTYADGLSSLGQLEITIKRPTGFEDLISELIAEQTTFDALILDLKLDGNQQGERVAKYTAPSLASGIRSKYFSDNGFNKEFPIFLISSEENLKKYYDSDTASHDLFDNTFTKIKIGAEGVIYEKLIESIVSAYEVICKGKNKFSKILDFPKIEQIESRIFTSRFMSGEGASVSEISQFIFNEIVNKSGILIDEDVLAARLGIDIKESLDWGAFLNLLNNEKYSGVYSNSLNRWWFSEFLFWWNENFPSKTLIQLNAAQRVALLIEKFHLEKLVAATAIEKTTSTKFWTVCQAYKKPLDPKDGFLIDGNQLQPWQDKRYISLQSILERDAQQKGLVIHPEERERLDDIKSEYTK
jgi:hypothetical protein